jgi:hypothetical protein
LLGEIEALPITYSCGAVPVAALKLREKWAGLMHATDASSLTVKSRSGQRRCQTSRRRRTPRINIALKPNPRWWRLDSNMASLLELVD